jgi:hypothetical protein
MTRNGRTDLVCSERDEDTGQGRVRLCVCAKMSMLGESRGQCLPRVEGRASHSRCQPSRALGAWSATDSFSKEGACVAGAPVASPRASRVRRDFVFDESSCVRRRLGASFEAMFLTP